MRFLSNYLDFIFESVAKNEMMIYYSEDFRNILKRVSDKSSIAQALISAEESNQATDIYTLIDITEKNDTISLIQVNRIVRELPEFKDKTRLPYSIHIKNRGSKFWNTGRTEMKIGRWVKRLLTEVHKSSVPDSKIEEFVNIYKSIVDGGDLGNFELVNGEDIRKWYLSSNYEIVRGQLGNSCMRYTDCQTYFDIYVKNPEVCQLLILKSDDNKDKIKGRALVWKLTDGTYYMDRIYTINDSDRLLFLDYARLKKIQYSYDSNKIGENIEVQLGNHGYYNKYPYMDTFLAYSPSKNMLSDDDTLWPSSGYYLLQETDGGYKSDDVVWSDWVSEYIPTGDAIFCKNIQDYIWSGDAVYLEYKDEYAYPNEDVVWSEFHSENFYSDDIVYSELMSDNLYPDNEQVIEIRVDDFGNTDYVVKSRTDLYVEVDGGYYGRSTYIKNPSTGKYHFLDEKDEDGDKYSDTVYNKIVTELFGKNISDLEVKRLVYKRLIEIYKSGDNQKELEKIIEQSPKYKSLQVYWGLNKDETPNAERLIELAFGCLMSYTILTRPVNSLGATSIRELISKVDELNSERSILYDRWQRTDSRIMRNSISVCKTIEWSNIPDIYKLYLLLTL
jgi:hypothetical protein